MILSDRDIKAEVASGRLVISPFNPDHVQPSSIDLTLAHSFLEYRNLKRAYVDVREPVADVMELVEVEPGEPLIIHPKEFVLGSTVEWVEIPDDLVARLEGRSSVGRLGVVIHSTAGFVDPGFQGHLTLEISNMATMPIALYPGMRIAQMSFIRMTSPAERPYGTDRGSKYQGQDAPTASRLYLDFQLPLWPHPGGAQRPAE